MRCPSRCGGSILFSSTTRRASTLAPISCGGAADRHRLDAHRFRRGRTALGGGRPLARAAAALAGTGGVRALDRGVLQRIPSRQALSNRRLETSTRPPAAAVAATTAAASTPTTTPGAARRPIPPTAEVGVGAPLRRSVVVTHGAIDHRALDGAREDAADDLPEDLAALAAKRAARIVIALDARAIARAFELAAAARHLADVGADA